MEDRVDDGGADGSGGRAAEAGAPGDGARAGDVAAPGGEREADAAAAAAGTEAEPADEKIAGSDVDGAGELASDEWATPPHLFAALERRYGPFDVDLFASDANTKCARWISKSTDAFAQDWCRTFYGARLFGNPPYSRGTEGLLGNQGTAAKKGREAAETVGKTVCLVLQSTTDKAWFHDYAMGGADLVAKETIHGGPLEGVLLKLEATRCLIDLYLLRGRVSFVNPATGKTAGTGTTGTAVVVFRPRRRW